MNTVHVSICLSCGHQMKNWLGKCPICRCKSAHYVSAIDTYALDRKVKAIMPRVKPQSLGVSPSSLFGITLLSLFLVVGAYTQVWKKLPQANRICVREHGQGKDGRSVATSISKRVAASTARRQACPSAATINGGKKGALR
jgi:hypothetical protein